MKKVCSILILISIVLVGCSANTEQKQPEENIPAQNSSTKSYSLPRENRRGYNAQYEICPSSTSDGYYRINTVSKAVYYYDVGSKSGFFLCSQPGCTHDDESCQAWIGNVESFTEYHGQILATRSQENGSADLIRKDFANDKLEVLKTWKSNDKESWQAFISYAADDLIVFSLRRSVFQEQEEEAFNKEVEESYWRYDLDSGELTRMFPEADAEMLDVMAISGKYAFVLYRDGLNEQDFYEKHGENADYWSYYDSIDIQFRLYDMDTFDYTVVEENMEDFVMYTSTNWVYGDQVVYVCGDTIYLFDLTTAEKKEFLTMENIVNYWLKDHKVFFITHDKEERASFYYADIDDGNPVQLKNNGNTEVMQFSVNDEGESFFTSTNGRNMIRKEDFYAERYENATTY